MVKDFAGSRGRFVNPVIAFGADPWVLLLGGEIFCWCTASDGLYLRCAAAPDQLADAPLRCQFRGVPGSGCAVQFWAPEIHRLDGAWYCFVSAGDGGFASHRMFALRCDGERPDGGFKPAGIPVADEWAIDGTVFEAAGERWFVFAALENGQEVLKIARMASPVELTGSRVVISRAELPWERLGPDRINEGPVFRRAGGRSFLYFSANGAHTDNYCVGALELVGRDPLNPVSWRKLPEPVLESGGGVLAPGHHCFFDDASGNCWIACHGVTVPGAGFAGRRVFLTPFRENADGSPVFHQQVETGSLVF